MRLIPSSWSFSYTAVNLARPAAGARLYSWQVAVAAPVFARLVSLLWSALGALTSLRAATVRQAQQRLSIAMMVLFFIPALGFGALPASTRLRLLQTLGQAESGTLAALAAAVLIALDVLLLALALARFRRQRLIV